MTISPGSQVRLCTPDNPRLDRAIGTVYAVTEWGAYVRTDAAATGEYRAGFNEMVSPHGTTPEVNGYSKVAVAISQGYTGDECFKCGSSKMRRNGTCLVCDECGSTDGGCS